MLRSFQSGRFPIFLAGIIFLSGGVILTSCATDGEVDKEREAACIAVNENAREAVVQLAEDMMWEHKLYKTDKPVPRSLVRSGGPIPINNMDEGQLEQYLAWKFDDDNLALRRSGLKALEDFSRDVRKSVDFVEACSK